MAETNIILYSNYLPIKNKYILKNKKEEEKEKKRLSGEGDTASPCM